MNNKELAASIGGLTHAEWSSRTIWKIGQITNPITNYVANIGHFEGREPFDRIDAVLTVMDSYDLAAFPYIAETDRRHIAQLIINALEDWETIQ